MPVFLFHIQTGLTDNYHIRVRDRWILLASLHTGGLHFQTLPLPTDAPFLCERRDDSLSINAITHGNSLHLPKKKSG